MDWLELLMKGGIGAYDLYNRGNVIDDLQGAATSGTVDPFGSQRPYYQQQLMNLYQNPQSLQNLPGYQFALGEMTRGTNREAARGGHYLGTKRIEDLQNRTMGLASQTYGSEADRLARLAGAQFGPNAAAYASLYGKGAAGQAAQGSSILDIGKSILGFDSAQSGSPAGIAQELLKKGVMKAGKSLLPDSMSLDSLFSGAKNYVSGLFGGGSSALSGVGSAGASFTGGPTGMGLAALGGPGGGVGIGSMGGNASAAMQMMNTEAALGAQMAGQGGFGSAMGTAAGYAVPAAAAYLFGKNIMEGRARDKRRKGLYGDIVGGGMTEIPNTGGLQGFAYTDPTSGQTYYADQAVLSQGSPSQGMAFKYGSEGQELGGFGHVLTSKGSVVDPFYAQNARNQVLENKVAAGTATQADYLTAQRPAPGGGDSQMMQWESERDALIGPSRYGEGQGPGSAN
jgi:hypothetical protein